MGWGGRASLHRPVNCPACRRDTLGPLCQCCCFSVGCDLPPGSLPSPSVVQLADSDSVVLMTRCCARGLPEDIVMCSDSGDGGGVEGGGGGSVESV